MSHQHLESNAPSSLFVEKKNKVTDIAIPAGGVAVQFFLNSIEDFPNHDLAVLRKLLSVPKKICFAQFSEIWGHPDLHDHGYGNGSMVEQNIL